MITEATRLDVLERHDRLDLIVVGGGFWGCAIADVAARRGWSVLILDDGDEEGASRNAAGYVRWEWLEGRLGEIIPEWWEPIHVTMSKVLLEDWGAREVEEDVHDYRSGTWKVSPGLFMVNPWEVLSRGVRTARVRLVNRTPAGWQVLTSLGDVIPAHRVAVAAGVWTDPLLAASDLPELGVESLTGSAILAAGDIGGDVETYNTRPYHHVTARRWQGGRIRVGETVSRAYPDSRLGGLINDTSRLFPQLSGFEPITGRRPVLPVATVRELGDGLVVAVGGHRIGLALAGGVAQRVMEVLG